MLGRRKAPAPVSPPPVVGDGKGRATPKRNQAQAARKQPLVPATRSGVRGKGASKEANKAAREAARAERARNRELMMAGDERYLQARDKGPVRRLARDMVDGRWNVGELLLPVMLVVVLLSFSGLQTRAPQIFSLIFVLVYGMLIASTVDAFLLARRVKRQVTTRFGTEAYERGITMYVIVRAFQLRRSRIPRPGVARGEPPR